MMYLLSGSSKSILSVRSLFVGAALLLFNATAFAELMIYPTRLVIEGNQRATKVEMINNGSQVATYRISLVNRRMSETGAFSGIDEPLPGERFSDDMLRYSPRQITLAPGSGQTVRLMVRKPANLEPGEYRSHLLFSKQPSVQGGRSPDSKDEGVGVRITTLVGVSIPVIVRHGATSAHVELTGLQLIRERDRVVASFVIGRTGNQSVYGDLVLTFRPDGEKPRVVGSANGVAVYTPNPQRKASIVTNLDPRVTLSGGTLQLIYREQAEDGGRLLAQESVMIP
ncbi:molecular chaperone [Marinobacter alexandrii]|uniref:fimbrial biogenesis chaperone n=1 Tax=Marinobacter alexandrii TaxID=2570351 RepID=UPI001FFF9D7C|nr:molecular chaperone [Marinobacter alexandrii]MCK2149278.1 molecular chaperone [Marinobacter alexandrii]